MEKAVVNDVVNKETVEDIKLYPIVENLQRGITKETCMKFGVRASLSEKDGKTPTAYYFPSYNQKGEVIGYKKQDVTKNKDEKYHWTSVGTVAIGNKLFGQNVAEQVNRKHTNCVYTEGEWDCLSVFQAQCDSVKGTKYEGHQPFVVSIPLGTKNAVEAMLHNKDFVLGYDSMTIFFDDDQATPLELKKGVMKGKEAREAVAAAFIGGIELWSVQPTNGKKDASDYMQVCQSNELAKLVQFGRKPLVTEKIVKADVLSFEDIVAPREEGIYVESFPNLMEKIHGFRKRELVLVTAPSGVGKCHGKGTPILMHDMTVRLVEDIWIGDKVMGADGEARTVLNLSSGFGKLYRVDQVKGDSYVINENHVLSLKPSINYPSKNIKAGDVVNISLPNFLGMSKSMQGHMKGYKADLVKLGEQAHDLDDAYMLGLWLADGTASKPQYTVSKLDKELEDQVKLYATKKSYSVNICPSNDKTGCTGFDYAGGYLKQLRDWHVLNNKHIPSTFLTATYETRLELLAGILDGDGHVSNNGFDIVLKQNQLAEDLILLVRSLGLSCSVTEKFSKCEGFAGDTYTRLHIFGHTDKIPNRLSRKKCKPRKQIKDALRSGITITQIGDGEYFGFEVDGDHLYCLGDFTVTHNSTVTSIFADSFVQKGEKVGMIFLEEEIKDTVQRLLALRLKVNYVKFKSDPLSCATREQIAEAYEYIVKQDRVVLLDHFGSLPVSELMSKIKHMHFVEGCSYILLDHLSMVISGSQVADERKELDMVMTELAAFCAANDVCIIAVSHINRTGADQFRPPKGKENESYWVRVTKEMLRGSAALEQLSWTILGLEPEILPDRSRGNVRLTVLKNRTWGFLGEADEFSVDQHTWEVVLADKPKQPIQPPQSKESVTIKPKCLDDDPELGF
jgi:replicative DNA helicase